MQAYELPNTVEGTSDQEASSEGKPLQLSKVLKPARLERTNKRHALKLVQAKNPDIKNRDKKIKPLRPKRPQPGKENIDPVDNRKVLQPIKAAISVMNSVEPQNPNPNPRDATLSAPNHLNIPHQKSLMKQSLPHVVSTSKRSWHYEARIGQEQDTKPLHIPIGKAKLDILQGQNGKLICEHDRYMWSTNYR